MGIPGLLKEIGRGERIALAKLAVDHLEKHGRPLRLAIDAAIWDFQQQAGQGGKNPALRTLFYRLLRLLALPIHPVFVYDGKSKPLTKRGKTVSRYGACVPSELSKNLVARFQFPHHTAPGEAEAECAFLQKNGIVDAVMSQDVDAIMFGSTLTLRDWSKEGTKGNKAPTHVNVLDSKSVQEAVRLDSPGMILVALLSGGDYSDGIPGFGPAVSCSIARAGFGAELIEIIKLNNETDLKEWRKRLQYELETNESGYFHKRHKTLKIPNDFPDRTILSYYLEPAVTKTEDFKKLEGRWTQWWDREIDIRALRDYVGITFDWLYKEGATKFVRCLAQPLFQHQLKTQKINADCFSTQNITDQRRHPITDGIPELRFTAVPADVVRINLEDEEENPEFANLAEPVEDEDIETVDKDDVTLRQDGSTEVLISSQQKHKPSWSPYAAEKWWIPQSILKLGLPNLLADWEREQSVIRADPKMFATRKCRQPAKSALEASQRSKNTTNRTALRGFVPIRTLPDKDQDNHAGDTSRPATGQRSRKTLGRIKSNPLTIRTVENTSIKDYFDPSDSHSARPALSIREAENSTADHAFHHKQNLPGNNGTSYTKGILSRAHTMPVNGFSESASGTDKSSISMIYGRKLAEADAADEIDLICTGSRKLPPPISSFFKKSKSAKDREAFHEEDDKSSDGTLTDGMIAKLNHSFDSSGTSNANRKPHINAFSIDNIGKSYQDASMSYKGTKSSFTDDAAPRKKLAVARDSLPGAWRELLSTPSRSSSIAYVDLTGL